MSVYDQDPDTGLFRDHKAFQNPPGGLLPLPAKSRQPRPDSALVAPRASAKWVASWSERSTPAGGMWNPLPFDQARAMLVEQVERNLDRWGRQVDGTRPQYEHLLTILRELDESELRRGAWGLGAGVHLFGLVRE